MADLDNLVCDTTYFAPEAQMIANNADKEFICAQICFLDDNCNYFSIATTTFTFCIGCKVLPDKRMDSDMHTAISFEMNKCN